MVGQRLQRTALKLAGDLFAQSLERGALPMLDAFPIPDVTGGDYSGPGGFLQLRGPPERQHSVEGSYDQGLRDGCGTCPRN